jgi:hypothetical protein
MIDDIFLAFMHISLIFQTVLTYCWRGVNYLNTGTSRLSSHYVDLEYEVHIWLQNGLSSLVQLVAWSDSSRQVYSVISWREWFHDVTLDWVTVWQTYSVGAWPDSF